TQFRVTAAESGVKRAAAAAGGLHVRVIELKPGAFHGLDVIHLSAFQIKHAGLIDKNLQTIVLVRLVQHTWGVFERHRIAESGTTPANHRDSEASRLRLLRIQDFPDLIDGCFCQIDHVSALLPLELSNLQYIRMRGEHTRIHRAPGAAARGKNLLSSGNAPACASLRGPGASFMAKPECP